MQRQINRDFQIFSFFQIFWHLIAYGIAFIRLLLINAGGYMGIGKVVFIGMSIVSLPLIILSVLLARFSFKLSKKKIVLGYCFHGIVFAWSIFIVYVSYL
jgi:hypothetical protein